MTQPVRIPADIAREDRLIGELTARQVAILAVTATVIYLLWTTLGAALGVWVFAATATPLAAAGVAVAVLRRDGVTADRLLWAALQQRWGTRRLTRRRARATGTPLPEGLGGRPVLAHLPARAVRAGATGRDLGIVDLGRDGIAILATANPINFTLRSATEQEALVAGFARWLHSLNRPVQILVRTKPLDLTRHVTALHRNAATLPHPALTAAAHAHADHLAHLGQTADLLRRDTLLVFREPTPDTPTRPPDPNDARPRPVSRAVRVAEEHLRRRVSDAEQLLGALGIRITPLDAHRAAAALTAATHPDHLWPPHPEDRPEHDDIPGPSDTREQRGTGRDAPARRPALRRPARWVLGRHENSDDDRGDDRGEDCDEGGPDQYQQHLSAPPWLRPDTSPWPDVSPWPDDSGAADGPLINASRQNRSGRTARWTP